jgi:1,4-dihydroxy-2-naphthoate octaprenyltransferase
VGPPRAAASGLVRPEHVRAAALGAFAVAAGAGLALSLATDPHLLLLGALAILAAWLYTGGPRPYGYLGLGEVFVFVFFGLVAGAGTVYVNELRLTATALLAGAGAGLLAVGILDLNNIRDAGTDALAGKHTLAVRWGRDRARALLGAVLLLALVLPVAAALHDRRPSQLLALLAAPLLVQVFRWSAAPDPPTLICALKRCAEAELVYALLWSLGVLL